MHLANGAITPECAVLTYGAAATGLAASAAFARRESLTAEKFLWAAGLGALVFAAQTVNVPIWPGISAHLVGGVLLAWILGPSVGALTMAAVLAIQSLALGDGGIAALGANILNMALLPAILVAMARRLIEANPLRNQETTAGLTAALAVPLAAALIVLETSIFRSNTQLTGWSGFATAMIVTHLWIGLLEGVVTVALVAALSRLTAHATFGIKPRPAIYCLLAAMLLTVAGWQWSSSLPDGYESAAINSGQQHLLSE
jgi:cobalt/nickel transport system permease protein